MGRLADGDESVVQLEVRLSFYDLSNRPSVSPRFVVRRDERHDYLCVCIAMKFSRRGPERSLGLSSDSFESASSMFGWVIKG